MGLPRWSCFACGHCQPLTTLTPSGPPCPEFGRGPLKLLQRKAGAELALIVRRAEQATPDLRTSVGRARPILAGHV